MRALLLHNYDKLSLIYFMYILIRNHMSFLAQSGKKGTCTFFGP